jgi:hypothetical protein
MLEICINCFFVFYYEHFNFSANVNCILIRQEAVVWWLRLTAHVKCKRCKLFQQQKYFMFKENN